MAVISGDLPVFLFFFFSSRRRHTRYWRDWSSDVCSSDLGFSAMPVVFRASFVALLFALPVTARADESPLPKGAKLRLGTEQFRLDPKLWQIGRASCRERV